MDVTYTALNPTRLVIAAIVGLVVLLLLIIVFKVQAMIAILLGTVLIGLIAALATMVFLGFKRGYSKEELEKVMTKSLEPTGMILLVTACGGVLRYTLQNSGLGEVIGNAVCSHFNDSGFWMVKSLLGLDEKTTLKT